MYWRGILQSQKMEVQVKYLITVLHFTFTVTVHNFTVYSIISIEILTQRL